MQPPKEPSRGNPRAKRLTTDRSAVVCGTDRTKKSIAQRPAAHVPVNDSPRNESPPSLTLESFAEIQVDGKDNTPDTTTHSLTYVASSTAGGIEQQLASLSLDPPTLNAPPSKGQNDSADAFDVPPFSHESPKMVSKPAPRGRSTSRASSMSSIARERSSSVSRRSISGATGGMVRETFRLHMVMQGTMNDEIVAREDVEIEEGAEFSNFFRQSLVARVIIAEILQRQLLAQEEDNNRFVLKRQALANSESLRLEEERRRAERTAKSQEVMSGDNKLYDRIVRKRQRLGLEGESKTTKDGRTKMEHVAKAGKQASEEDVKKMIRDRQCLEQEVCQLQKVDPKKRTRKMEQELQTKSSRLQKLIDMLEHHSDCVAVEKNRAERAVHMKGVDRDVLTGKKSVAVAMVEKDQEEKRKQHEEELEIALRRALQTDKVTTNATGRVGVKDGTLLKLPSIAHSTEPSVMEKPLQQHVVNRSPSTRHI